MTEVLSIWRGRVDQRPLMVCNEKRHRRMPESVLAIVYATAIKYGVAPRDIVGRTRTKHVAHARFEAMYRVRNEIIIAGGKPSLPLIGAWFGGRDHTTVIYALRKHEELTIAYMAEAA